MIKLFDSLSFYKLNNIFGWCVFLIALCTYTLTLEPTTSFWDCGEYIATAYKIQVGHPPGAPFFVIIANFFSNLAFGNSSNVAWMVNFMSALCSAFTILFLYWTITILTKKIIKNEVAESNLSRFSKFSILFSGLVGALIYTFSDSFWFSAVEGEVYAMSSLFTALVFWCILKWEKEFHDPYANRWLVFIAFLIGLSVGVHMLNLLAIPAITSIYLYKNWNQQNNDNQYFIIKTPILKFITINIIGVLILALIYYFLVPQTVNLFGKTELYFINELGLSFNSGTLFFLCVLIIFIIGLIIISHKKKLIGLNTFVLSFMFFLIGYSSFFVLVIRSNANTPIDENSPEDAVSLLAYLNREQYGTHPLIHGHYFNSSDSIDMNRNRVFHDGNPVYVKGYELKNWNGSFGDFSTIEKAKKEKNRLETSDKPIQNLEIKDKYIISDHRKSTIPIYKKNETGFFPRMWSKDPLHIKGRNNDGYLGWSGKTNTNDIPSFSENIRFFWNYQIKHMYMRYFMWNFSGKQCDIQGHGDIFQGNWITGINFIDNYILGIGPQKDMPTYVKNNPGRNTYFLLPFLLGLFGMISHFLKRKEDFWAVFLLFFFTGIAIVIELNQTPYQPRERDYAYVGSFFAFSIWTGFGCFSILNFIQEKFKKMNYNFSLFIIPSMFFLGIPTIMAYQNWDDHDRSNRYTARDFAMNYLDSCEPNAILFTMGDNDTFPLWYVQEVESYRTDVRIVNLSLLNTDWYIDQMKKDAYDGESVPFSIDRDLYKQGTRDLIYFYPYSQLIIDQEIIKKSNHEIINWSNKDDILESQKIERKALVNQKLNMLSKNARNKGLKFLGKRLNINIENATNQIYLDSIKASEKNFYLKDFNDWIKSDFNYTKLNLEGGKYVYSPIQKIKIPVNKNNVLKNNIVSQKESILIEDHLFINFSSQQGLDKKSLMMLDLIEQNNWERPIYFAITIGSPNQNPEPFLFLNNYLQLDGMVYQLVPIKNTSNEDGRINSSVLYENIINEFQWGGMDVSNDIYMDETNQRMVRNFKNIFIRLTKKLIEESQLDKAELVIQKSTEIMRPEIIPLEIYDLPFLENYLDVLLEKNILDLKSFLRESGSLNYKKLIGLIHSLIERYNSEIIYYSSFRNQLIEQNKGVQDRIFLASQSIRELYSLKEKIPILPQEKKNLTLDSKTEISLNKIIELMNGNTISNDITILVGLIQTYYTLNEDKAHKLVSETFNESYNLIISMLNDNQAMEDVYPVYEILDVFLEFASIHNHPELKKIQENFKTINNLMPSSNLSNNNLNVTNECLCIEKSLTQGITTENDPCINVLTNLLQDYFQKNQIKLKETEKLCPGYIDAFMKQIESLQNNL